MTDADRAEMAEQQRIENTHTGVSIKAKIKRGTGTRDQDELVIKGKGADAEEAAEEFEESLEAAESGSWAERLRQIEAGDSDE